jgi:hypothetical protein
MCNLELQYGSPFKLLPIFSNPFLSGPGVEPLTLRSAIRCSTNCATIAVQLLCLSIVDMCNLGIQFYSSFQVLPILYNPFLSGPGVEPLTLISVISCSTNCATTAVQLLCLSIVDICDLGMQFGSSFQLLPLLYNLLLSQIHFLVFIDAFCYFHLLPCSTLT